MYGERVSTGSNTVKYSCDNIRRRRILSVSERPDKFSIYSCNFESCTMDDGGTWISKKNNNDNNKTKLKFKNKNNRNGLFDSSDSKNNNNNSTSAGGVCVFRRQTRSGRHNIIVYVKCYVVEQYSSVGPTKGVVGREDGTRP